MGEAEFRDHVDTHAQRCHLCNFVAYSDEELEEHEIAEHDLGESLFTSLLPISQVMPTCLI